MLFYKHKYNWTIHFVFFICLHVPHCGYLWKCKRKLMELVEGTPHWVGSGLRLEGTQVSCGGGHVTPCGRCCTREGGKELPAPRQHRFWEWAGNLCPGWKGVGHVGRDGSKHGSPRDSEQLCYVSLWSWRWGFCGADGNRHSWESALYS